MNNKVLDINNLIRYAKIKNYDIFTSGEYNLNIWAIRSNNNIPGKFDDKEIVFWRDKDKWKNFIFNCTTDPGKHYLKNLLNPNGTAILVPDQYKSAFKLGYHKGDRNHPALIQSKPVTVFRDGNRDYLLDFETFYKYNDLNIFDEQPNKHGGTDTIIYEGDKELVVKQSGYFGINNHRAHENAIAKFVGKYSAGCIVIQNPEKYYVNFIPTLEIAKAYWGDSFTFTLVSEKDICHKLNL